MGLTSLAIGLSTLLFQTITQNRILTPSIIGLDSLYGLLQTLLLYFFGSLALMSISPENKFMLTVLLMVGFALVLYQLLFKENRFGIYFLLLVGLILGAFFSSISTFLQVLIDPNEFLFIQDKTFASINNVNQELLKLSSILILANTIWLAFLFRNLDILALGRSHAINLGINYTRVVRQLLIIIAIYVSISTALIGPIVFFGLLAINITYQLMNTYRHLLLALGVFLVGFIALALCQLIIEHVLNFSTALSVVLNLIGGSYFIYLLLKGTQS